MAIIFNIDAAIQNSKFNVLQEPIKFIFEGQKEAFELTSIIEKAFTKRTTDKYREEFRSVTSMGEFKPTEDMEPAGLTDFEEAYNKQYTTQIWTNSYAISLQTIEDGDMSGINPTALQFIRGFYRGREKFAANILAAGLGKTNSALKINASTGLGMDTVDGTVEGTKQQYFHSGHKPAGYDAAVSGKDFTQSNKFYATLDFTGADPEIETKLLDVVEQAASRMRMYKDDNGNILAVNPTRILIGEDYRLRDTLERALKSKYGASMGGNGVNLVYGKYELVSLPLLSGVDGFEDADHAILLVDPMRNEEGMGAVWFDRLPLSIDSYIDQKTKANVINGRARYGAGFGDFRAMSYINLGGTETSNATLITPLVTSVKKVEVVSSEESPVYTLAVESV